MPDLAIYQIFKGNFKGKGMIQTTDLPSGKLK